MTNENYEPSSKSRTAALLFAFFLGTFGAHRFYTGKKGSAILMLILAFSIVGTAIAYIWSIIDLIFIATGSFEDSEGRKIILW